MSSKRKSPPTKLEGSAEGATDQPTDVDAAADADHLDQRGGHAADGERPACKKSKTFQDGQVRFQIRTKKLSTKKIFVLKKLSTKKIVFLEFFLKTFDFSYKKKISD